MNIVGYIPLFAKGTLITCCAWIVAGTISLITGIFIGIVSCNSLTTPTRSKVVRLYTFIAKGIPAYVQILIAYFVIPAALGINVPGFFAATCALAFCSSGYMTEIIRAGINTIPTGQWDASYVLGYSLEKTLVRIILPQAFHNSLPSMVGEFEQLLKSTSLLAAVGITELTRTGMNIISRELNPIPIYCLIAIIYLMYSALLQIIITIIKKPSLRLPSSPSPLSTKSTPVDKASKDKSENQSDENLTDKLRRTGRG